MSASTNDGDVEQLRLEPETVFRQPRHVGLKREQAPESRSPGWCADEMYSVFSAGPPNAAVVRLLTGIATRSTARLSGDACSRQPPA